ncbi:ubiquitin-like-specific protease 1 isoform X2 [Phalaenopsis equestris]|uniref:ubiquitin-like-specific protease 1 isoform X2 n=1 Tax=Phalaenopsis equestris TaxID=78828 RepID=UPI0009E4738C|nr:ubiquitin-like-specific protease 1 isoform X2 [Phalaenopsis equestris]
MHVEVSPIVPYYVGTQPSGSHTYEQSSQRMGQTFGFEEIHDLLKSQQKIILDFQVSDDSRLTQLENTILEFEDSVYSRLTTLENTVTDLKLHVVRVEKSIKQAPVEFPRRWVKESPQRSLIKRIKNRLNRRRKSLCSPYVVFERKRKKEPNKESVENKEEEEVVVDQVNKFQEEVESVHKEEEALEPVTHYVSEDYPDKVQPAAEVINFPARDEIPDYMRETIDICCRKYTDFGDLLIDMGHISVPRRYIDEFLGNGWLGNEQVDCFAMLMENKRCAAPQLYRSYLYVSPCHWLYRQGNVKPFVEHITKDAIQNTELILIPIINNQHWILLVGTMNESKWRVYDSLPNRMHLAITQSIIEHFLKDTSDAFEEKLIKWPVVMTRGIPVQSNSYDCGVYVCKYMETLVRKEKVNWAEKKDWQELMHLFRAEIVYDICKFALDKSE